MTADMLAGSAVLLGQFSAGSPEWHAARASGIGGSEVAAILGLSPWQSPFSLWHAKANGWESSQSPEMEWGHYVEPALLAWYFDHSESVEEFSRGGTYARPGRRWQHANPDALGTEYGAFGRRELVVVEAKKGGDEDWGRPGTDEVPVHYRVQGVWYCDVLDAARADFIVTNYGRAPRVYTVRYDPEEARLIRGHAAAFWRSLQHGIEPPLDDHVETIATVRRLHPEIDGTAVAVDEQLLLDWHVKCAAKRVAEAEEREANARVLAAMGDARRAQINGRNTAIRVPSQGGATPHLRTSRRKTA